MASEESINCAPIPSVKAICTKNIDPWRQKSCDELHVGETYIPDYFVIGNTSVKIYRTKKLNNGSRVTGSAI